MFAGFVKVIPVDVEEAALIDGCNPLQTFFFVVMRDRFLLLYSV